MKFIRKEKNFIFTRNFYQINFIISSSDDLRNPEFFAFCLRNSFAEEEIARFADVTRYESSNFARRSFRISEKRKRKVLARRAGVFASQTSCLSEALLAPFS